MEMEEINQQISNETRRAFQVSMQLARLFVERFRRELEQARQESVAREREVRRLLEDQRRLAAPVIRRGMNDAFWQTAQPADAAYVYGVAARFQNVDPLAQATVDRCQHEARERWNVDIVELARLDPDVDSATLGGAPVLKKEDRQKVLADSTVEAKANPDDGQEGIVRWDSPQARQAWANDLLARGHDPAVVRAVVAGDQALHRPASMATKPVKASPSAQPSRRGRRPRTHQRLT